MKHYTLDILSSPMPLAPDWFQGRPIPALSYSLERGAEYFVPGAKLQTAINVAIALGEPLLITGEPGTGKTQVAYYIAHRLQLGSVLHFQVKSTSRAQDLLYDFDLVRYFREVEGGTDPKAGGAAHEEVNPTSGMPLELRKKMKFLTKRQLWDAFESRGVRVLLVDEVDKAPKDFTNDLLLELDQMRFEVPELKLQGQDYTVRADIQRRPIVVITSNSERRLPEPFLRRCVYHHITFDEDLITTVVMARRAEYSDMSTDFLRLAISRFIDLRGRSTLRKKPSTGELLTWLRIIQIAGAIELDALKGKISELPFLETLIKDHLDLEELSKT